MIDKQYKNHVLKNSLNPVHIKDIKKGDKFYERGCWDWYKFEALEDAQDKGNITIAGEEYKQYMIFVRNEHMEDRYLLVTDGLAHYNGKYYK